MCVPKNFFYCFLSFICVEFLHFLLFIGIQNFLGQHDILWKHNLTFFLDSWYHAKYNCRLSRLFITENKNFLFDHASYGSSWDSSWYLFDRRNKTVSKADLGLLFLALDLFICFIHRFPSAFPLEFKTPTFPLYVSKAFCGKTFDLTKWPQTNCRKGFEQTLSVWEFFSVGTDLKNFFYLNTCAD